MEIAMVIPKKDGLGIDSFNPGREQEKLYEVRVFQQAGHVIDRDEYFYIEM